MTMRAVGPEEAAQADFAVCSRVLDLVPISRFPVSMQALVAENRQNSTRQPCENCGQQILVSSTTPAGPPRICTVCHEGVKEIANRAAGGHR